MWSEFQNNSWKHHIFIFLSLCFHCQTDIRWKIEHKFLPLFDKIPELEESCKKKRNTLIQDIKNLSQYQPQALCNTSETPVHRPLTLQFERRLYNHEFSTLQVHSFPPAHQTLAKQVGKPGSVFVLRWDRVPNCLPSDISCTGVGPTHNWIGIVGSKKSSLRIHLN